MSFDSLLEGMSHYDKDNRFMAASDLVTKMTASSLDSRQQARFTSALLKQLSDTSIEVQGNAAKCISRIVSLLQPAEVMDVISNLAKQIVEGAVELRDVYATCFKGLLKDIPDTLSKHVWDQVIPKAVSCFATKPIVDLSTKEQIIDVVIEVFKRFGSEPRWHSDLEQLCRIVVDCLSATPTLKKRAVSMIGCACAAPACGEKQLEVIISAINSTKLDRFSLVQALGAACKGSGSRIIPYVPSLLPLLLETIQDALKSQDEQTWAAAESALLALENLSAGISDKRQTISVLTAAVRFDPFFMDAEGDDDFDEDFMNMEDEDSSWKIRLAAVKAVSAGFISDELNLEISSRLAVEREEVVKVELINALRTISGRAKSCDAAQVLIDFLAKPNSSKFRLSVEAALLALSEFSQNIPACRDRLGKEISMFSKYLRTLSAPKDCLSVLTIIANCHVHEEGIVTVIREVCLQRPAVFYKVTAAALLVCGDADHTGSSLLEISSFLKKGDADPEVKEAAITAFGNLFARPEIPDPLFSEGLSSLLEISIMKSESTRAAALRVLATKIFTTNRSIISNFLKAELVALLVTLISPQQRSNLRQSSLLALVEISRKFPGLSIPQSVVASLPAVIAGVEDAASAELAVQLCCAGNFFSDEIAVAAVKLAKHSAIQPRAITALCMFAAMQPGNFFSLLCAQPLPVDRMSLANLAQIAASCQEVNFAEILKSALAGNSLAFLILGESGKLRKINAACCPEIVKHGILKIWDDNLRVSAASALGGFCVSNPELVSSLIIPTLQGSSVDNQSKYLLCHSLLGLWEQSYCLGAAKEIMPVLFQIVSDEGVRGVAGENLAALLRLGNLEISSSFGVFLRDSNAQVRQTALTAIRVLASGKSFQGEIELFGIHKEAVIGAIYCEEYQVRRCGYAALHAIAVNTRLANIVLANIIGQVMQQIVVDVKINPALVKEVDLGPFKHRVDEGLPLRKAAASAGMAILSNFSSHVPEQAKVELAAALAEQKELSEI